MKRLTLSPCIRLRQAASGFLVALLVSQTAGVLSAQVIIRPRYWHYGHHSAIDAIASRVYASAEMVRSIGEASVNSAHARRVRAQAISQEIENARDRVRAVYDVRAMYEADRLKRAYKHLDSHKKRNNKTWDRIKNHPDLCGPSIVNGRALNFLMHRLSGSVLAFEYSGDYQNVDAADAALRLDPATLKSIILEQKRPNGKSFVFRADEGVAMGIDWWPRLLREGQGLDAELIAFTEAREELTKADRSFDAAKIDALRTAYIELSEAFHKQHQGRQSARRGFEAWERYKEADSFLKSLASQLRLIDSSGNAAAFTGSLRFDPARDGDNLVALLQFMFRNGLQFAPARPGEDRVYHRVFQMSRDLYVNVADDDEGIAPKKAD